MRYGKVLSIVIPVYNEEEAIGTTVEEALAVREEIRREAGLDDVEIVVVNDGSSDRTVERVRAVGGVRLIVLDENQGYGAAIKTGFRASRGDIFGFMDGDGTCRPSFFGRLVRTLREEDADIVLGSRLNLDSNMPPIRRFGNVLFAGLLSLLSGTRVRDSASGMRVLKRECLNWIDLLPDGLDFTPAMSAVASFSSRLTLVELPMPYRERRGRSKLNILTDGVRFLRIIVGTAYTYLPFRFFMVAGSAALAAAVILGIPVLESFLQTGGVESWLFYRIMAVITLAEVGLTTLLVGVLADGLSRLVLPDSGRSRGVLLGLERLVLANSWIVGLLFNGIAMFLVFPGLLSYVTTGRVTIHWSLVATALLLIGTGCNLILFFFMFTLQNLLRRRMESVSDGRPGSRGHDDDGGRF